jgi:hypothetical protein
MVEKVLFQQVAEFVFVPFVDGCLMNVEQAFLQGFSLVQDLHVVREADRNEIVGSVDVDG